MFETILTALGAGLSIWSSRERTKYIDELIEIKTKWYFEYSKPEEKRDFARLDHLELRLRILVDSFSSAIGTQASHDR